MQIRYCRRGQSASVNSARRIMMVEHAALSAVKNGMHEIALNENVAPDKFYDYSPLSMTITRRTGVRVIHFHTSFYTVDRHV